MTEIAFHFNVPDKLDYSCRLLRKACQSGARVMVTGEPAMLDALDQMLWTFSPTEFLPHCRTGASAAALKASSVWLGESVESAQDRDVLVNLGTDIPTGFEQYPRFIEVVARSDDDRGSARTRWKHYAGRGYELKRHDLSGSGGAA